MSRINYSRRFTIGARGADMNLGSRGKAEARFAAYVEGLAGVLGHADRIGPLRDYCTGLILPGERKSVEPMAAKTAPARTAAQHQSLLHFVGVATWSDEKVLAKVRDMVLPSMNRHGPIEAWIIDDTGFPKQGAHSVGVQHQYCGQLGKKANCQVAVTVHYVSPKGHFPAALRLYLPKSWTNSPKRLDAAGVPPQYRREQTKGQIALELLDQVRAEVVLPGDVVLTDACYGASQDFREGLGQRGLFYIAGVTSEMVVFTEEPRWIAPAPATGGRPQSNPHLADDSPRPVSLGSLADRLPRRKVTWREGTKGELSAKFAWVRAWPAQDWARGGCAF